MMAKADQLQDYPVIMFNIELYPPSLKPQRSY
jgi:hypothetical protein